MPSQRSCKAGPGTVVGEGDGLAALPEPGGWGRRTPPAAQGDLGAQGGLLWALSFAEAPGLLPDGW